MVLFLWFNLKKKKQWQNDRNDKKKKKNGKENKIKLN